MAAPPTDNSGVKCLHHIPGGMFPGKMIRVQGVTPPGARRFAINLQCGPNIDAGDDIAFHFDVRFTENCVVRNHRSSWDWGLEERGGGLPLRMGESFEALILCEQNSIKVALNGAHFCEFVHRLPYQRVNHITLAGDVMLTFINFEGAQSTAPGQYLSVPCVRHNPGGMRPGNMIRVQGSTPAGADRFSINLQYGPSIDEEDDIAFHFDVRFLEDCVVRNHCDSDGWGLVEERNGRLPIRKGDPFEILFHCKPNAFEVNVNGAYFCEFVHRMPYQRITYITVVGDVTLTFLGFV